MKILARLLLLAVRPITIGRMVNSERVSSPGRDLGAMSWVVGVVGVYMVVALGTVLALIVMASTAPALATDEAWGHAVVVAAFAVLLPVRLRAARSGSRRALRVVAIIAAILVVVNALEAALPGVFPTWMRLEMVAIAALMLLVAYLAVRAGRR